MDNVRIHNKRNNFRFNNSCDKGTCSRFGCGELECERQETHADIWESNKYFGKVILQKYGNNF